MQVIMFDRQSIFIHGMRISMQQWLPGVKIRGVAKADELWQQLAEYPDAVLMLDSDSDSASVLGLLQKKARQFPHVRVLLIASDCTHPWLQETLQYHVLSIVSRDAEPETFAHAINSVAMGMMCLPGGWRLPQDNTRQNIRQLSGRQMEILKMLASGESNKQISRSLNISAGTVKAHLESLYRRLDVKNRTQAALMLNQINRC